MKDKLSRRLLLAIGLIWCTAAHAVDVTDSAGRVVGIPDHVGRVLPAGPPAAVLLAAIAPDMMIGWPGALSLEARAFLPAELDAIQGVPRVTGRVDVSEQVKALKPDLILDYGAVTPRYAALARVTQEKTGTPTLLLDGALEQIPAAARLVGHLLHRESRAEAIAMVAEHLLAAPLSTGSKPHVLYARGDDGLTVAAAGTDVTAVFAHLGWPVVAPTGDGTFRVTTIEAIRQLDPDLIIFSDPAMHTTLKREPAWRTVRAVRDGNVLIAPSQPFGWIEEPPSINRLLGLAWLNGIEPKSLTMEFHTIVYGRTPSAQQLSTILDRIGRPNPR